MSKDKKTPPMVPNVPRSEPRLENASLFRELHDAKALGRRTTALELPHGVVLAVEGIGLTFIPGCRLSDAHGLCIATPDRETHSPRRGGERVASAPAVPSAYGEPVESMTTGRTILAGIQILAGIDPDLYFDAKPDLLKVVGDFTRLSVGARARLGELRWEESASEHGRDSFVHMTWEEKL